ncbi:MAG: adenylosuccinate synthetase [Candidatus Altiarchaeota archaeon]
MTNVSVIVGGFFGDEGKGKVISYLAKKDKPEVIARAGVGPNAGHTVYHKGKKFGLRLIPSGFVNEKAKLFIGAGVLIDVERFLYEVELTNTYGRIFIDKRCGIIEQKHKELDSSNNFLKKTIGTTGSGCGPANADRANRKLKLASQIPELKDFLIDVPLELNDAIERGEKILVEASQGFGLSLFYGTYPQVTSKDTTASMALADVGIGPTKVGEVIVVYKAYLTRVGEGEMREMITEENVSRYDYWLEILNKAKERGIKGSVNEIIAEYFNEKGTVTQRLRRIGNFDFSLARYSAMINGATQIAITCLDRLFPEVNGMKKYENLSERAKSYIEKIQKEVKVKITLISTGPEAGDIVDLRK